MVALLIMETENYVPQNFQVYGIFCINIFNVDFTNILYAHITYMTYWCNTITIKVGA